MSLPSRERELKHEIADHLVVLSPSLPSRERELKRSSELTAEWLECRSPRGSVN